MALREMVGNSWKTFDRQRWKNELHLVFEFCLMALPRKWYCVYGRLAAGFACGDFHIIADALEKANDGRGLIFSYPGRQSRACFSAFVSTNPRFFNGRRHQVLDTIHAPQTNSKTQCRLLALPTHRAYNRSVRYCRDKRNRRLLAALRQQTRPGCAPGDIASVVDRFSVIYRMPSRHVRLFWPGFRVAWPLGRALAVCWSGEHIGFMPTPSAQARIGFTLMLDADPGPSTESCLTLSIFDTLNRQDHAQRD